jgi:hypothetical protein
MESRDVEAVLARQHRIDDDGMGAFRARLRVLCTKACPICPRSARVRRWSFPQMTLPSCKKPDEWRVINRSHKVKDGRALLLAVPDRVGPAGWSWWRGIGARGRTRLVVGEHGTSTTRLRPYP